MGHWMETRVAIHDNGGMYKWEILSIDEGMISIRYLEPDENGNWKKIQDTEMCMDVAKRILREDILPKVEDLDDA